jgi:hypothetical protein
MTAVDRCSGTVPYFEVCVSKGALINWKEECKAIHTEMDRLLTAGWPKTPEERQVRKIQFMALMERRNVSAQNFLKSDPDTVESAIASLEIHGLCNADPRPEIEPEASRDIARDPQAPPANPMFEVRHFLKALGLK